MDRDDVTRVRRIVFDLLAKLGYVHVNRASQGESVVAPDAVKQLVACDDLAFVLKKEFQDFEHSRRQVERTEYMRYRATLSWSSTVTRTIISSPSSGFRGRTAGAK